MASVTSGSTHGRVAGRRGGGAVEVVGVDQAGAQLAVVGVEGEGDRQRAVVALEHGVLEVAEVAADGTVGGRRLDAREQPVEAREVDDAGVLDLLVRGGRRARRAIVGTAERRPRAATTIDAGTISAPVDEAGSVGRRRTPVTRGPATRAAPGSSTADHRRPMPSTTTPWRRVTASVARTIRRSTHSKVVRRQARATRSSSPGRGSRSAMSTGRLSAKRISVAPASSRAVEHVGVAVAQQVAQPGQQGVGVADLGGAPAIPLEGGVRVGRQRRGVALDQGDPWPARDRARAVPEAGHAGAHHDDGVVRAGRDPVTGAEPMGSVEQGGPGRCRSG